MIYLWRNPERCAYKFIAVYNKELSMDRFLFRDGVKLPSKKPSEKVLFEIGVSQAEVIAKYDGIPNNSASPLVNQKIVDLLIELAPDEVQFFDAEVHCKDGVLTNYKLLNVTNTFIGVDYEKSICEMMLNAPDIILGFRFLTYKEGCMEHLKIARNAESLGNILVTEEIKQAFEKNKIKGPRFIEPEKFYR